MPKKSILINVTEDESRIAIVEDNLLQELLIEHASREQNKGNIYKGVVVQFQPSVQAAFVDYGGRRHGFLPMAEVNPDIVKGLKGQRRGSIKLKVGQEVLVQVTREEVDKKGAALTTNCTLAGRYMVMMPHTSKGGVSKKITDQDERDRLKTFLTGIEAEEHAVIIRTAGVGRDLGELKKDYTRIKKHWERLLDEYEAKDRPGLISEEQDVITRTLRDYYTDDVQEIWVDNPEAFQTALSFLKENYPRRQKDLKLFVGERSLYASYNIEKQVEQLTSRSVKLPSGGSIVIDQTEALVAIDVNSGRSNRDSSIDDTALRTNLEAAEEVARQLRLRNMGGLIVVDFIDLEKDSSRKKVLELMEKCMARDKAQHKILPISQFGLMEISRQRMAQRISSVVESVCPTCKGKGNVPSAMASANLIIRSIRDIAARGNVIKIQGDLPLELANQMLNEKRQAIMDLELEFGIEISLQGDPSLLVFDERNLRATTQGRPKREERPPRVERSERSERSDRGRRRPRYEEEEELELVEDLEEGELREEREERDQRSEAPEEERSGRSRRSRGRGRGRGRRDEDRSEEMAETEGLEAFEEDGEESDRETSGRESAERGERGERSTRERKPRRERRERTDAPPIVMEGQLHSGCLFGDLEDLSEEETKAVVKGFNARLSGKANGQPPARIAERFTWTPNLTEEQKAQIEREEEAMRQKRQAAAEAKEQAAKEQVSEKPARKAEVEEGEEESKPAKKPASRSRGRKKPEPKAKADEETGEETEQALGEEADSTEEAKPAKKPASRSRSRKKPEPKAKADEASAEEAKAEDASGEEAEEAKPAKKPASRSRKKPAPKAEAKADEASDSDKEAKPAKKPASRSRKKPAPKADAKVDDSETRETRARKKKSEESAEEA